MLRSGDETLGGTIAALKHSFSQGPMRSTKILIQIRLHEDSVQVAIFADKAEEYYLATVFLLH